MDRKVKLYFFIFTCILGLSYNANAQLPDHKSLTDYLNEQRAAPDAIQIVTKHLEQSATAEPVEELIRWTNAGFPELRDKNNFWNTEPYSIYWCVVFSINYFFSVSQSPDKAREYLEVIERLKKNSFIVSSLTQFAFKILKDQELKEEFFRLVGLQDSDERVRGLLLGRVVAEKNRDVFDTYVKTVKQDKNAQVRNTGMHVLGTIHRNYPKEVALVALEQLFVEKNESVREISSTLVKQGANSRLGWTKEDAPFLLFQLLKTDDVFVQKTIGITVAKLTTEDRSLLIDERKISETFFDEFFKQVKFKENDLKRKLEADELLTIWKKWWTPLIPEYTIRLKIHDKIKPYR